VTRREDLTTFPSLDDHRLTVTIAAAPATAAPVTAAVDSRIALRATASASSSSLLIETAWLDEAAAARTCRPRVGRL
jgi:hypothetical protein